MPGLRYAEDVRTVSVVALYFATTAAAWAGWGWSGEAAGAGSAGSAAAAVSAAAAAAWWVLPFRAGLVAACCWLSLTGAIITHNLAHVPVFRGALANQAFHVLVSLTYGHPVSSFVPGHNMSHHRFTQTRKDYMRSTKVGYRWNLLNLLLFMPTVAGPIMRSDLAYTWRQFRLGRGFFWRFLSEAAAVQAANLALLWLSPARFLLLWLLPHLWAQYGIVAINFMQHDGCEGGAAGGLPLKGEAFPINGARNFTGGLLNALLFNNGYHTIHHMYPHLHWSVLPELHAQMVAPRIDPRLNEPNFARYFLRTFVLRCRRLDFRGRPLQISAADAVDEPWMEWTAHERSEVGRGGPSARSEGVW